MKNLLTRDEFREGVFKRDDYKCVICNHPAKDAHHICERRLFDDGGYYLANGVSLCSECHIKAEQTLISCEELWEAIGQNKPFYPPYFYTDTRYDKWGNIIVNENKRTPSELFYDESVQKILAPVLHLFDFSRIKYPKTRHLPWSPGINSDDRTMTIEDLHRNFDGKEVYISTKMDGENSSVYSDGYFHARSLDGNHHPSQDWLKNYIQKWFFDIPEKWRVCGENLYAEHSLKYEHLESYFQVFSIWNDKNYCLSLDETREWCNLLGIKLVPVVYEGKFDIDVFDGLFEKIKGMMPDDVEGYVLRTKDGFHYSQFQNSIVKFVRKNHVQEGCHNWMMCWDKRKINKIVK